MHKVSVIIPNYNHAIYLKQRIESVLNQSYLDFELIILDDCSTDHSREVIECYRLHPKVSTIAYNQQNSGSTFRQWMKGISLAKGEFIWIAESDDWCEPTFLESIIPYMIQRPDCVIGYCQAYCVVGNEIKAQSSHSSLGEYIEGLSFIRDYMISTNSIYNASMAVWRKDSFENISHDFVDYKFVGDWLFWIELSSNGSVFVTGKLLNYFRKHDKDVSGKAYTTGYNYVEEFKLLNVILDKGLVEMPIYKKEISRKFHRYYSSKKNFSTDLKQAISKEFTKHISYNTLYRNYITIVLKYRVYRFLKNFIEKNR